jgi:hypothetical protein
VNQFLKMFQQDGTFCTVFYSDSPMKMEGHILSVTTRCCNYSLLELLMMGEYFTRNMYSGLQGIKYCTKSAILLEHLKKSAHRLCLGVFRWISAGRANISLYNIDSPDFYNQELVCFLYRKTWIFKYNSF